MALNRVSKPLSMVPPKVAVPLITVPKKVNKLDASALQKGLAVAATVVDSPAPAAVAEMVVVDSPAPAAVVAADAGAKNRSAFRKWCSRSSRSS